MAPHRRADGGFGPAPAAGNLGRPGETRDPAVRGLPNRAPPGRSAGMTPTTAQSAAPGAATFASTTMLSMREVCELTGKPGRPRDRKTIAGWIDKGRYPHAVQATTGRQKWSVPVQDLVDAGDLDSSQVIEVTATLAALRESRQVTELRERICRLESELAVASALAAERQTSIEALHQVLALAVPAGAVR